MITVNIKRRTKFFTIFEEGDIIGVPDRYLNRLKEQPGRYEILKVPEKLDISKGPMMPFRRIATKEPTKDKKKEKPKRTKEKPLDYIKPPSGFEKKKKVKRKKLGKKKKKKGLFY